MHDPNLQLLEAAARLLEPLLDEVVFVGGCANSTIDVMPVDEEVLGFANRWHLPAMDSAERVDLAGLTLRCITPIYFVATKLEAFHGRGNRDYYASHDLEDAMTVIDGRDELVAEVLNAPHDVRAYIGNEFAKLLRTTDFVDAMPGFLPPDEDSQARLRVLQQRVAALAG